MRQNPQETVQCLEYLFTNIPSDKTIDICIDYLYNSNIVRRKKQWSAAFRCFTR